MFWGCRFMPLLYFDVAKIGIYFICCTKRANNLRKIRVSVFKPCLRRPFAIRGSNVEIAVPTVEIPRVVGVVPLSKPSVRAAVG